MTLMLERLGVWWRKELTKNNVTMYLLYPRQWRNISWCGRRNEGNRCSVTYCQCLLHWQNFFEMFYFSSTIVNKLSQFPSSPDGIVRKTCASVRLWHLLCTTNLIQTLTLPHWYRSLEIVSTFKSLVLAASFLVQMNTLLLHVIWYCTLFVFFASIDVTRNINHELCCFIFCHCSRWHLECWEVFLIQSLQKDRLSSFFVPPCGREHLYFGVFGLDDSLFSCCVPFRFNFVLVLLPLSETWSDAFGCYGDSVQYHVFDMSRPLPRFSMYSLLDIDHAIPEPQSHVTFHVKERVNRVSCFRLPFRLTAPCGLWGCKNKPAPFRGRMS